MTEKRENTSESGTISSSFDSFFDSLTISNLSIGRTVYPPGGMYGPRMSSRWGLIIIHSGSMVVSIDQAVFESEAATVFLSHPGYTELYKFSETDETTHSWVLFELGGMSPVLVNHLISLPRLIPLSVVMLENVLHALNLRNVPLSRSMELVQAVALYLFWLYVAEAENIQMGISGDLNNSIVNRAREYIHIHLFDDFNVGAIAYAVGISSSQLTRQFREVFDTSPMNYVWRLRTQRGIELLKHTGLPVGVIAHQCGFKSQAHFARRVKQETRLSPRQFRQSYIRVPSSVAS